MTDAERTMLSLLVKALDDILYGLERGNGCDEWNQVSSTWADKSNPLRERLRQEEKER